MCLLLPPEFSWHEKNPKHSERKKKKCTCLVKKKKTGKINKHTDPEVGIMGLNCQILLIASYTKKCQMLQCCWKRNKCVLFQTRHVLQRTRRFSTINRDCEWAEASSKNSMLAGKQSMQLQKGSERFNISELLRRRSTGKIQPVCFNSQYMVDWGMFTLSSGSHTGHR